MKTEDGEARGLALTLALPKLLVGLAIVAAGVIFTLDNFNLLDAGAVLRFWPAVLILIGLAKIATARPGHSSVGGWVLLLIGGVLLAARLFSFDIDLDDFWPLILVLIGGWLVMAAFRGSRRHRGNDALATELSGFALMAGNALTSGSQEFRGGDLAAVMGGLELDLRGAALAPEGAVLDVFVMWGGVEIHVPEGWTVESRVLPVMAAYEDQTRPPADPTGRKLLVRGLVLMGGIEVNHKPSED